MCVLLINGSVGTAQSTSRDLHAREDGVSIFESVAGHPALGKTYSGMIDLSIFVSRVLRNSEKTPSTRHSPFVGIFEVLRDRKGQREGNWAAFEASDVSLTSFQMD